jgi:LEA14-like dessication related protein
MMKRLGLLGLLGLSVLLSGCIPGASRLISTPTFRIVDAALVQLNPPGIGDGAATFRLNLEVTNPNAFGLTLAGLEGNFFINDRQAAATQFRGGVSIAAQGTSPLTLDVRVPLVSGLALLGDLAGLIAGSPTRYRVDGVLTIDVLGTQQRLPSVTLVSGTLTQPVSLAAPTIRFNQQASGLRELTPLRATFEIVLDISNPLIVGYQFEAPSLSLSAGGAALAGTSVISQAVPARGDAQVALRFQVNTAAVGFALLNQIQALAQGGSLNVTVDGAFTLELPGITSQRFSAQQLASGLLR